ncbi:DMT family transporter [Algihabitans sp.]|uniref:DMT family transporter n=1 Tax=Algihabitans sp. TaxID=2821514 RepID=UPI003BAB7D99
MGDAVESRHSYGVLCVVAASVFTSLAGLLVRLTEEADGWTLQFWRQVCFLVFIFLFLWWRHGRRVPEAVTAIGLPGLVAALALGMAFVAYLFALIFTSVANVVFIGATSPIFAALLAWLVLRERLPLATWLAMVAALIGIGIMVGDASQAGAPVGTLLALIPVAGYAVMLVCIRARRNIDMLPAAALAGVFALLVSVAMADDLSISRHDFAIAAIFGVVQLGLQYVLTTLGARHVPAGEVALLGRLQIVLAPLWVWLAVNEVPSNATFIGGAIVLSAVFANAFHSLRGTKPIPQ